MSLPLTAQNALTQNTGAQASLHININVVRAAEVHDNDNDKDRDRHEDSVSYDLNPRHEEFSVTEDVRPMLVESNQAAGQEQVRIISVVLK
ncbi:MAG TPA: hypothetical protein VGQ12_14750 [Candidatus Angelobacter sp.]|nr:hypothetical protein [Candidatus Angelobacter sp.]